jgi:hypothetical protein
VPKRRISFFVLVLHQRLNLTLAFAAQADGRAISATIFYKRPANSQKCGSSIDDRAWNLIPILCEHMLP